MNVFTSRKAESAGRRYFSCPLKYTVPKEACSSFVWETDLLQPGHRGFRLASRGSNGEFVSQCTLSLEVVSDSHFSALIVPPNAALTALLEAEGGQADHATIESMGAFARQHPCVFTFPLQQHAQLVAAVEAKRAELSAAGSHIIISPVPDQAMRALLTDIAHEDARQRALSAAEDAAAAAVFAEEMQDSAAKVALSLTQTDAPSSSSAAAADPADPEPPAAASATEADDGSSKKKKYRPILVGSGGQKKKRKRESSAASADSATAASSIHVLSAEDEGCLNERLLVPQVLTALLPFQLEGVRYAVGKKGRCLIADEMGLGKSIQAIAVAAYYHRDWPLLIICPSSLRLTWQDEICKWLPFMQRDHIFVVTKQREGQAVLSKDPDHKDVQGRTFGIVIISYDIATALGDELKKAKYRCVIVDESHALKSIKAKRTKVILPLLKQAKRAILLSGTPALNRPEELYTQITTLQPKLFPSLHQFGMRYCDGKQAKYGTGMDFKGSSHLKELHVLLKKYLLIRRDKKQVLSQLPAKRRQAIMVDVPKSKCALALREVEAQGGVEEAMRQGGERNHQHNSALMKLWQVTGDAKLKAVQEYIDDLIGSDIKFLVFAHHLSVLDALETHVRKSDSLPSYIRIDGSTPLHKRQEQVTKFQQDEQCRVALLSITAAGVGITLHAASHVVFAELHWTPAYLVQAEDRVHRIGQKSATTIHYVLGRNTLDDLLWPLISRKLDSVGRAVSGEALHLELDETKDACTDYEQRKLDQWAAPAAGAAAAAAAAAAMDQPEPHPSAGDFDSDADAEADGDDDDEDNLFRKESPLRARAAKQRREEARRMTAAAVPATATTAHVSSSPPTQSSSSSEGDLLGLPSLSPPSPRSGDSCTSGSRIPSASSSAATAAHSAVRSPPAAAAAVVNHAGTPRSLAFASPKAAAAAASPVAAASMAAAVNSEGADAEDDGGFVVLPRARSRGGRRRLAISSDEEDNDEAVEEGRSASARAPLLSPTATSPRNEDERECKRARVSLFPASPSDADADAAAAVEPMEEEEVPLARKATASAPATAVSLAQDEEGWLDDI